VAISTGLRWRFQSASSGDFRRPVQDDAAARLLADLESAEGDIRPQSASAISE